jgi:hypothetical protein
LLANLHLIEFACFVLPQVDTKGEYNPIKQDEKKGKARLYHGPIFWNYGCLPQTCALATCDVLFSLRAGYLHCFVFPMSLPISWNYLIGRLGLRVTGRDTAGRRCLWAMFTAQGRVLQEA